VNDVRPPMAVPARAAKADMYAASIGSSLGAPFGSSIYRLRGKKGNSRLNRGTLARRLGDR